MEEESRDYTKEGEIEGGKEGWRKYQTDNVGQREVIENIWVRSYQNSPRESMIFFFF